LWSRSASLPQSLCPDLGERVVPLSFCAELALRLTSAIATPVSGRFQDLRHVQYAAPVLLACSRQPRQALHDFVESQAVPHCAFWRDFINDARLMPGSALIHRLDGCLAADNGPRRSWFRVIWKRDGCADREMNGYAVFGLRLTLDEGYSKQKVTLGKCRSAVAAEMEQLRRSTNPTEDQPEPPGFSGGLAGSGSSASNHTSSFSCEDLE
jgi:hypothetical protein